MDWPRGVPWFGQVSDSRYKDLAQGTIDINYLPQDLRDWTLKTFFVVDRNALNSSRSNRDSLKYKKSGRG